MDFTLSEEQNLLIKTTESFVKSELVQHENLLEKTNHLSIYYLLELNYNLGSSVYFRVNLFNSHFLNLTY